MVLYYTDYNIESKLSYHLATKVYTEHLFETKRRVKIPIIISWYKIRKCLLGVESGSDLRVENKHKGGSDGTEGVGTSTLEESRGTLVTHDLSEAISSSLVNPLRFGLLRLHLKTTTDGIEWVRSVTGGNSRELGATELGSGTENTVLGLLVRVVSREGIEETEVDSTVRDDTNNRNSNTVVKTSNTRTGNGLLQTVNKTVELFLSGSDIRGKTGTGIIERVNDHEGTGTGKTTGGHVDGEEFSEFGLLVGLGEHGLDGILEGEVESLCREITDDVGQVTTPESLNTLFGGNTGEAVNNTGVTGDFSGDNLRVSILGLDEKLNTLNWGCARLGNGSGDTSGKEIDHEIRHGD
mmetsp:Transcript_18020/g.25403  ORF Transcript_18020/g.25403 Transcript_18020/m.25403 type:complete len:352 (+) Transcript_18020:29-1084(+)